MSQTKPDGPWHEAYQPMNEPVLQEFVQDALARAVSEFGEPVIPVNEVLLRRSKKTEAARRYRIRENFSLTECIDSTNGTFVIYIGVDQNHPNFYPLLAHECAHLINPKITDWYMEGIATRFSEEIHEEKGMPWGDWKRHFMRSRRAPYALSYRMMMNLKEAFPEAYPQLIQYTAVNEQAPEWRYIDIDRWLDSLSESRQEEALDIIYPFVKGLSRSTGEQYKFAVPSALQ